MLQAVDFEELLDDCLVQIRQLAPFFIALFIWTWAAIKFPRR
jgi:hypothetical protein